jgi:sugar phosphate isomerase/epimerase
MTIALHGLSTKPYPLLVDVRIARETGYDALEIVGDKLFSYLKTCVDTQRVPDRDNGYTLDYLKAELAGFPVAGITFVGNVERQAPADYAALLQECQQLCEIAQTLDCPMVQLLTGPLDPKGDYQALAGVSWPERRRLTAKNLAALGDIGKAYRVKFYLEGLAWSPLNQLAQLAEVIDAAERDNVGLVIDFWHLWSASNTPDDIARLNKHHIFCVHCCDSLAPHGQGGDATEWSRDVWIGGGYIPIKHWVDAVRSTGFDGWYSCEQISPKYWQMDPFKTAGDIKKFIEYMLV